MRIKYVTTIWILVLICFFFSFYALASQPFCDGSFDNLSGQIWHAPPSDHKVAVYIRVGSGWWNKPSWASPLTSINCDGSWTTDITTGVNDHLANTIAAYLVPNGYAPPLANGQSTLPPALMENSIAHVEVTRNP